MKFEEEEGNRRMSRFTRGSVAKSAQLFHAGEIRSVILTPSGKFIYNDSTSELCTHISPQTTYEISTDVDWPFSAEISHFTLTSHARFLFSTYMGTLSHFHYQNVLYFRL